MIQPIWSLVYATDYEALYVDSTGQYDPELAVLAEYETERGTTRYNVYRFSLDQCTLVDGRLVEANGHEPWFAANLDSVAATCDHASICADLCSDDPRVRARAYSSIGSYHGYDNLDTEPRDLTESAVAGWPELDGRPEVTISVSDDDDGFVTLYCSDVEAARDQQTVLGSRWECPRDMDVAYASVMNQVDFVNALLREGYEVDFSEWSSPDDEDFRYWHAKNERENGAAPDVTRAALGWRVLADVVGCRRVQDAASRECLDEEERVAYYEACFAAGFPLDAERWYTDRQQTVTLAP